MYIATKDTKHCDYPMNGSHCSLVYPNLCRNSDPALGIYSSYISICLQFLLFKIMNKVISHRTAVYGFRVSSR
jgi:hypothetical protein